MIRIKSKISTMRDLNLARDMIVLGSRPAFIYNHMQVITKHAVKSLYLEIVGTPPPRGMSPSSDDWYMQHNQSLHSSTFIILLKGSKGNGVFKTINAFRKYIKLCKEMQTDEILTLDRCLVLINFINANIMQVDACFTCKTPFPNLIGGLKYKCNVCHEPRILKSILKDYPYPDGRKMFKLAETYCDTTTQASVK